MEENYKDSIILKRNVDGNENPIAIDKLDIKQVMDNHSCIVLEQIPDESYGLDINGFSEVYDSEHIGVKNYRVSYAHGVVYFNPVNVSKTIQIGYKGIGSEIIYCSRIASKLDRYGNVVETIEELIKKGKDYLDLIKTLGDAVVIINKLEKDIVIGSDLHTKLLEDIRVATPLQKLLHQDIIDATVFKDELKKNVEDGKVLNAELTAIVERGDVLKPKLDESVENAQDSIDIISAAGNKAFSVTSEKWIANTGDIENALYKYNITHDMASENLQVEVKDAVTKMSVLPIYKTIDNMNILMYSNVRVGLNVVLSASYYNGGQDIAQEVIEARNGEVNLKTKINTIDSQLFGINTRLNNNKIVNLADYGIIGDGITDYSTQIQTIIETLNTKNGGTLFFNNGEYVIGKTLKFYDNVNFIFETGNHKAVKIIPLASGTYINNYMILINSTDGINPYKTVSSLSSDNKVYSGITIDNSVDSNIDNQVIVDGLKGIFLCQANCKFERITSIGLKNTLVLADTQYLDNIIIENSLFMLNGDYPILKNGKGECLTVKNCKVYASLSEEWKLLKANYTYNLDVRNIINGTIEVINSTYSINNIHLEEGKIKINKSSGELSNATVYNTKDGTYPIEVFGNSGHYTNLRNIEIMFTPFSHPNAETGSNFDILLNAKNVTVENFYRTLMFKYGENSITGIKIDSSNETLKTTFNNNSSQLSLKCTVENGNVINKFIYSNPIVTGANFITSSIDTDYSYSWTNVSTPLVYTCQIIYGDNKYLMGANMTNEVSVTSGNKAVSIKLLNYSKLKNCTLRLFRGSTSGQFSAYVDIPLIGVGNEEIGLLDTGAKVNGFPWIYSVNTLVNISSWFDSNIKYIETFGDNIVGFAATTPKSTNFVKGDRVNLLNENKVLYFNGSAFV